MIRFTDLIVQPYIMLIIEFLDRTGLCICNHFENDIFNLSITNKELHFFMKEHKLIEKCCDYHIVPEKYRKYFMNTHFCFKHHISPLLTKKHLYAMYGNINNIERKKEENKINKPDIPDGGYTYLFRKYGYFDREYVHTETQEHSEALKAFLQTNSQNINLSGYSCCTGRGFSISITL